MAAYKAFESMLSGHMSHSRLPQTTKVKREKSFAAYWISSNSRENFRLNCILLKKVIAELNFRDLSKIRETFIPLNFCRLRLLLFYLLRKSGHVVYWNFTLARGGSRGGGQCPSLSKFFCIGFFHLIQHENIIHRSECLISFTIIQLYIAICIKCTIILRLTPLHCLNPTIKSITILISIYEAKVNH